MRANTLARAAADAFFGYNVRFAVVVHFHLACTAAAAHANVFNNAAEAGHFVSFKMIQADDNIGVHQRLADFGFFYQFAVRHRHISLVRAL